MRCRWCRNPLPRKQAALALVGLAPLAHRDAAECAALAPMEPVPPEDYDWTPQPPADIDVCSYCGGMGERITGQDWETGAPNFETCRCTREGHPGQAHPWLVLP